MKTVLQPSVEISFALSKIVLLKALFNNFKDAFLLSDAEKIFSNLCLLSMISMKKASTKHFPVEISAWFVAMEINAAVVKFKRKLLINTLSSRLYWS